MKNLKMIVFLCAVALLAARSEAQNLDERVDAAIAALKQGTVADATAWCNQLVIPAERGAKDDTEARMVLHGATLQAGTTPALGEQLAAAYRAVLAGAQPVPIKAFILEQFQYIAGVGDLAAVTPLLRQPELADAAARVVINIGSADAAAALAAALPGTAGDVRLALVRALGVMPDKAAIPTLLQDTEATDEALRLAALGALAATGEPQVGPVLLAATRASRPYLRAQADDLYLAFLRAMARGTAANAATQAALTFAETRRDDEAIQCACLEILGHSGGGDPGLAVILNALTDSRTRIRMSAGRALAMLPAEVTGPRLVAMLDQAPPDKRVGLVDVMADLGVTGALPALRQQLGTDNGELRRAVILALGRIGGMDAVPDLVGLLDGQPAETTAAAADALVAIPAPETGAALAAAAGNASANTCAALLGVLARRLDTAQSNTVLGFATDPTKPAAVHLAAWNSIGALASAPLVGPAAAALATTTDTKELKAAGTALAAICRRSARPDVTGPALLAALNTAKPAARIVLLQVLPAGGGDAALAAATAASKDPDKDTCTAAVRALADWPDSTAMPALKDLIATSSTETHYVLAFRGYMRLLNDLEAPVSDRLNLYAEAAALSKRPDEQKLVLSGLGTLKDGAAFAKLLPFLDDEALRDEAATAITQLAQAVRGSTSNQALNAVVNAVKTGPVATRAQEALAELTTFAGCVVTWELSGPYTDGDKGHTEIFPVPFAPEQDPRKASWSRVVAATDGRLDLMGPIGGDNRCAYMRSNVLVPAQTEAHLLVGSDDGVKVWLNGNVVHENNVPRGFAWCEDSIPIVLLEGTNTLMLKITQGGGGWEANARIVGIDGRALDRLDFAIGDPVTREIVNPTPQQLAAGAPTAAELGWRMSIQCWSFNSSTFFESVDRAARMGVTCIEMFPGQKIGGDFPDVGTDQGMSLEAKQAIKAKLQDTGIQVVNFGVTGIPGDEAGRRQLFDWAKDMGIETICAEPDPSELPGLDPWCAEYGINIALHNHPKPSRYWNPQTVLDACKGLSTRMGACADTGHWMRSGINPLDAITLLEGRIVTFHFKDLNTMGPEAHDVHWGTGEADVPAILRLLKKQGFKGVLSSEYEYNWGKNTADIAACVRNLEAMAREIVLEEGGLWKVLFNMRDLDAWHNGNGQPPAAGWSIDGDCLALNGSGGYIWTRERYADFELDLDFNTSGNSGLFFRTDNPADPVQTGIEMQVYTDAGDGKHGVGAMYDLLAPSKSVSRPGWNHVTLGAKDNLITVVLNGELIIGMDVNQWTTAGQNPDGSANKFTKALKDFRRDGFIGFQDHGSPVKYRNIRIRPLN